MKQKAQDMRVGIELDSSWSCPGQGPGDRMQEAGCRRQGVMVYMQISCDSFQKVQHT